MTTTKPSVRERFKIALNVFRDGYPRALKQSPFLWPAMRQGVAQWQIVDFNSYVAEGFQLNTLIYSAIMYKVRSAYYAPLRAYSGDEDHPEVLPLDHPLAALAHRPNSYQSNAQFMGANTVYLNVAGNAYVMLDRPKAGALPTAMYPLRPDRVWIIPGDRNIKGYLYVQEGKSPRDGVPILPEDIIHVRLPNPGDPLEGMGYGLSPFAAMSRSADVDNAVTNYLKLFFQKGTAMNVYLKFDVPMDDSTISQVKHRFQEIYGGYEKWADVGVIDQGGSIESFGQTFKEMGFEAIDDRNESRVLGPFGVPGILIGTRLGVNRAINANAKELRQMFWEDTMLPELGLHEAEYQYYLRSDDGAYVMFDTSKVPALRKDIATTVNAWAQLVGLGVPKDTASSVVGLELGALPDGDVVYMPLSLIPMGVKKPTATVIDESAVPDATNPEQAEGKKKGVKYSDDQPRDDSGRWSDTGGGGSSGGDGGDGSSGGNGGGSSGGGSGDGSHASMDTVLGDASTDMRIYSDLNDSPNKEAIGKAVAKHLRETSGAKVSSKEGFEMARAVHQYAGNDNYRKIRSGEMPETTKQLDNLVSKSTPYQGNIYRGMSFGDDFFKNDLYPGASFDTRGVSSWSSDKKHADMFANRKQYGVLLSVKNKSGASITFLSKDEKEQEVLNPSTARYRVKSVKMKQSGTKEIYHVQLEEE